MPTIVALIPARGGSKRIEGKNLKPLGGKPLLQWTIEAARASGIFDDLVVSTDDNDTKHVALECGDDITVIDRPAEYARNDSPDIHWVQHALKHVTADAFAILRPTSPFRTAQTIRRAWSQVQAARCSSLRAVEPVKQHPGKMWQIEYGRMAPLIEDWPYLCGVHEKAGSVPWHSRPTQTLHQVYVQNSSLEMAWTWCVTVFDSISGPKVAPFYTEGWEGFSIDYPEDWERAEAHAQTLLARV